jgi:hypothetical protein
VTETGSARPTRTVTRLIGIYHADGGVLGELRYVAGKLFGTAHCSLCDITHAGVRRKHSWDAMAAGLGVGITLLHLNELDAQLESEVRRTGSPTVLAVLDDGSLVEVLGPVGLDGLDGSVARFDVALRDSLARRGLVLPQG